MHLCMHTHSHKRTGCRFDQDRECENVYDLSRSGRRAVNSLRERVSSKPASRAALSGFRSTCEANPTTRALGTTARIFSIVSRAGNVASDKSAKTRSGFSSAHRDVAASSDDAYATVAPSADATASILERKNKSRMRP